MIRFKVSEPRISFRVFGESIGIGVADAVVVHKEKLDEYKGSYMVTPTNRPQVLKTKGKAMTENLVVDPIPNNYGLVTYNQDRTIKIT